MMLLFATPTLPDRLMGSFCALLPVLLLVCMAESHPNNTAPDRNGAQAVAYWLIAIYGACLLVAAIWPGLLPAQRR